MYVVDPRKLHKQVSGYRADARLLLQPVRQCNKSNDLTNGSARLANYPPNRLLSIAVALHQPADRGCFFKRVQILSLDILNKPEFLRVSVANQGWDRRPPEIANGA
jgi:hypothetical protein